jgi:Rps23 Pro-64 3,4-dihydroxylase Tpa1-like proline 4-hydroxylase
MHYQYDEESIKVYDNFFDEVTREDIFDYLQRPKWSLTGGSEGNKFWHMDNLEEEEYFSNYLFEEIKEELDKVKNYNILRVYANGQTSGQYGTPHVDDGEYTLLYYPNPDWNFEWQGNLNFLNLDHEIGKIISYKPNRLVCFPANMIHYADPPSMKFNGLRISLAYKLVRK